ncbi:MAG: TVP38/TMEM64 family protein [Candidatus Hodarchaeota archaeon]
MTIKKSSETHENKQKDQNIIVKAVIWLQEAIKRTFSGHSKSTWIWIIIFILISLISGIILFLQHQDETWLFEKVIHWFVIPMIDLNEIGWFLFIILMGIQGILIPIPSELVLLSSGLIWGLILGSILGIIGSMAAGVLTYYIAVLGGRPMIERFLGQENLEIIDTYIDKYGARAILIARAFPFMPFDPISYASGFLKIRFREYFIATLFGSIIRCVFYAWLGSTMYPGDLNDIVNDPAKVQAFIEAGSTQFNIMLIIIVVILGSAYFFYQFILFPYFKKKHIETKSEKITAIKKS